MKFWPFFALIFSALQTVVSVKCAKGQITNELAYETSVLRWIGQKSPSIDTLTGFVTDRLRTEILLSEPGRQRLEIQSPLVSYAYLRRGFYERTISSMLSLTDSVEVSFPILFQDTLHRSQLKATRRSAHAELRGTDPRWPTKFLMPTILIGTGIAVIVSLFYLRS